MVNILGVSAYYHDSAACLVRDGHIIAAAQEERFTRKKFDARFPTHAIQYCLREGGISLSDLKYFVFYDKPLIKFERLLETYVAFSPKGIKSFLAAMPVWLKEKMLLKAYPRRTDRSGWYRGKVRPPSCLVWRAPRVSRGVGILSFAVVVSCCSLIAACC
jgi:predicted NodU family carbamoyl transferase